MKSRHTLIPIPSRAETLSKLEALANDLLSREEASRWAEEWVLADHVPGRDVQIDDWAVWESLKLILGADLDGGDRKYLHGREDFVAWAEALQSAAP
ncbi:MAG: hypothetical protein WBL74_14095 [Novosphingobium sp.]|uniref:hypothetical protein n=1 Tax=Novosphingobium sp. TaxID=1874826 RepID=UPI003C7BFC8F